MRAVITRTVPGTSSAGRARFRPWRGHVAHACRGSPRPARRAGPARRCADRRRPHRSGRIPAHRAQPRSCASSCLPVEADARLAHPPILETRTLHWPDEAACAAFAAALAAHAGAAPTPSSNCAARSAPARPPSCATCCARSACAGRIKSPTYAVLEPYELPGLAISHFDFYRFDDPREWDDAGFRDVFAAPGLKLAEWPEKAAGTAAAARPARWTSSRIDDDAAPGDAAAPARARGLELLR